MDDLIRRQEAIEICEIAISLWDGQLGTGVLMSVKKNIQNLPSAQPEQKTGKWVVSSNKQWHICPFCGAYIDVSLGTGIYVNNDEVGFMNYCPNCGAKMEE